VAAAAFLRASVEPAGKLVLGALVGGIAVSILLPIFKLSQGFE